MTTQDPVYDSENPRHTRVLKTLYEYVEETNDHNLYGGLTGIAARTRSLHLHFAADWADGTKIKPSDMPRWWRAGAFKPEAAQSLIELGIGPGMAGQLVAEGDTVAYQVSMGKLSAEQAMREIRAD